MVRGPDGKGGFVLEEVPAGRTIRLYAETPDGRFVGNASVAIPPSPPDGFQITLPLTPRSESQN